MAYIKGISCYTPPCVIENIELQETLKDCDVAKIAKGVGVNRRHLADNSMTAGDLAVEAANKLFLEYKINKDDIDFVILSTQSPDHFLPPTACIVQNKLNLSTSVGAFDFDLGCSGYVYGLAIAGSFVDSGLAKNVLLLTGDTITRFMHPTDNNRVLFGEAASATLISNDGYAEIGRFDKGCDGSGADCLIIKNGAARNMVRTGNEELDSDGNLKRDDYFYMNGNTVFNFTIDRVPLILENTLKYNALTRDDIDYYVFHQANKFMLNTLRKVCKIPKEKFYVNIEETGNTTSSTIPLALEDCIKNNIINSNDKVLIAGFGVGLSWAGTVLTFK